MGGGGGKTRGKKNYSIGGRKKPKAEAKKQSLGIIKNYLNHPQHTRLDPDSAFSRPQSETQALTGLRDQSRLAWLTLANQQLKSMKKKVYSHQTSSSLSCKNQNLQNSDKSEVDNV